MTYRQIACLWERYWERKVWDIETNVITNPMSSFDGEESPNRDSRSAGRDVIDATTDAGIAALQGIGIPITRR